ncbi:MAG: hypothetical protein K6G31_00360 [Paludibacteraceae bacterium]|nr:hypothetical protein [Paludibacteraceae bacterium]
MKNICIILFIFFLNLTNVEASLRIKRINRYLKDCSKITTSGNHKIKEIVRLHSIYNDYAVLIYKDSLSSEYALAWLDLKHLNTIDFPEKHREWDGTLHYSTDIAAGSLTCINNEIQKIGGKTLIDSIEYILPFKKNLIAVRFPDPREIGELVFIKTVPHAIVKRGIRPCAFPDEYEIISNKYFTIGAHLYDDKLRLRLDGNDNEEGICGEIIIRNRRGFTEIYPEKENQSIFFFNDKSDNIFVYDHKLKKKLTINFPFEDTVHYYYCNATLLHDDSLLTLVCSYRGREERSDVVFTTNGEAITPIGDNFTGFFKDYLLYDHANETSAVKTDRKPTTEIKLGRYRLKKHNAKWTLNTPFTTDCFDRLTGLNNNKYLGVVTGSKVGIIGEHGNLILPPKFEKIFIDKLYFICLTTKKTYEVYDKKGNLIGENFLRFFCENEENRSGLELGEYTYHYFFFKLEDGKYQYFLRKKKKSKVFYADEINTEDLSNKYLPIKKDGIWQYLEIK